MVYIRLNMYQKPRQVNLSDPEAYSEPCQISKREFFCENSQWLKTVNFFVKHFILDVWLDSEYRSVICYLLGKLRTPIRLIQLQCKFTHFKFKHNYHILRFNCYVQFHWQFLITYSGFWLVNILLWKCHTSSWKEMKII